MPLLTGGTEFLRAVGRNSAKRSCRKSANLRRTQISDEELDAHFTALPPRYFEIHTAQEILDDLELAHRFMHRLILENDRALSPVTAWLDEPDRGYNLVKICTWDRAGLFSKIAGSLSAAGLNILSAQIFTRADGIALDNFFVNDARTGNLATREQHDKFAGLLEKVLNGEEVDLPRAHRQTDHVPRRFISPTRASGWRRKSTFDNEASETRTLIEIETEDRLGLLYAISQTFAELAVDIAGARIVTERGAAIDSFYVRELDGRKVESPERQAVIEGRLRQSIAALDT